MSYPTIDYLPDLTPAERAAARALTFSSYSVLSAGWDYRASVYGSDQYALLHDTYRFQAIEGATYDVFSTSFFDPYLLRLYDQYGNAIVVNDEADDGAAIFLGGAYYDQDIIFDWVAPYSGTFYVAASWNQGSYFTYYSLNLYEDRDTVVRAPTVSIAAASADKAEGLSGITAYTFSVNRAGDLAAASSATWKVSSSQATGDDFAGGVMPSGTVKFSAGQSSATLQVNVAGDALVEPDEAFTVALSNPSGATVSAAAASGTIRNDDFATLSIVADQTTRAEGNAGSTAFTFTVSRAGATSGASSANWAVVGVSAQAADFAGGAMPSGVVSFAPGETSRGITVQIAGDSTVEPDEVFRVVLSSPVGATIHTSSASATILNDDAVGPTLSIAADRASVSEGQAGSTPVSFTVTRTGSVALAASAEWSVGGAYVSPWDFAGGAIPSGAVSFAPGESQRTVVVRVAGDAVPETDEQFSVTLSQPQGATLSRASATATIVNDDGSGFSGASPAAAVLPRSADLLFDAMTNGGRWLGGSSGRVSLAWAMSDSATGYFADPVPFRESFADALASFSQVANIEFNFLGIGDEAAARADIVFRPAQFTVQFPGSSTNTIARAEFPLASRGAQAGDVWLNTEPWARGDYSYLDLLHGGDYFFVVLHELGHALGLKHPHDSGGVGRPTFAELGLSVDDLIEFTYGDGFDVDYMTLMSYNDDTSFTTYLGDPADSMPLDIYALQRLYGANQNANAGDTMHVLTEDGRQNAICDAGGKDTVRLESSDGDGWIVLLDVSEAPDLIDLPDLLVPALHGWTLAIPYFELFGDTYMSEESLKWIQGVETLVGSSGSDIVVGSSAAEHIEGAGGNDYLEGGAGDDTLEGGAGDDVVVGGTGIDQALLVGTRSNYTVARHGSDWTVSAGGSVDGEDFLSEVEFLAFSDMTLPLSAPPKPAAIGPRLHADFLFDPVYYLLANSTVVQDKTAEGALSHWLSIGAAQGLAPNAWFDATWYGNRWPDLKPLALDDATLFAHFNLFGVWEGRAPGPGFANFDGSRYLRENADVAAYVDASLPDFLGSRTNGAIAHYILYGADEVRPAFDSIGQQVTTDYIV